MFYVVGYLIVRELKRNPIKVSKMIIGVIILTYIAELVLCISVDKAADGSLLSDARLYLTYVNPYFRILAEGLLGVMLCEYMPALQSKIRKWNRSFLEFAAVGIFLSFFVLCNFITSSILNAWIWFVPVSFLLIAFYEDDGMVSKAAEGRVWQFLGNISFEIYMTHAFVYEGLPVIAGILSIAFKDWLIYHAGTRFIITLVLCIIFAWVVHLLMNCKDRQRFVSSFKR